MNFPILDDILLPNRMVLISNYTFISLVEIPSGMSREVTHPGWHPRMGFLYCPKWKKCISLISDTTICNRITTTPSGKNFYTSPVGSSLVSPMGIGF
jgi:hypothetical protein